MKIGDYVLFHSTKPEWQKVQGAMGIITKDNIKGHFFVVFAVDPPGLFWCREEYLRVVDEREYLIRAAAAALTLELGNEEGMVRHD